MSLNLLGEWWQCDSFKIAPESQFEKQNLWLVRSFVHKNQDSSDSEALDSFQISIATIRGDIEGILLYGSLVWTVYGRVYLI